VAPIFLHEALWFQFSAARWKPNAVQVSAGGINAISGGHWTEKLSSDPQNYLVCPGQPWLDGINAGDRIIRQRTFGVGKCATSISIFESADSSCLNLMRPRIAYGRF
jgi:hypothetical protein